MSRRVDQIASWPAAVLVAVGLVLIWVGRLLSASELELNGRVSEALTGTGMVEDGYT